MKHYYLLFFLFFFTIQNITFAQNRQIASPMYLGSILIDQPSVDKMVSMCEYYNISENGIQNGFHTFNHPDGSEIRFKIDKIDNKNYPEVKITVHRKIKEIDKMLSEAGYEKTSDGYVKGSKFELRRTRCRISSGSPFILTFTKEYDNSNK